MRYQQFVNENTGLSYYNEPKEVTVGMSGLDIGGAISGADFKGVSTALYSYIFANVSWAKKATITLSPSYVPDMLRLYMNTVRQTRKSYQPMDYDTVWLPLFMEKGFDVEIIRLFFKRFQELNKQGLVPRSIVFPDPRSAGDTGGGDNGDNGTRTGMSTGMKVGLGVAAIGGISALYFAFK